MITCGIEICKKLLSDVKKSIFVKNMSKDGWLELRRKSLGGSDAGAIVGLNKWSSPLMVYLDKKGVNNFKGNEYTRRGSWLETPIRERCKEELGLMIEEVPFMCYSDSIPFMSANIDGAVYTPCKMNINGVDVQGMGGLEIKTSERGDGFENDEVPDSYYAQVQHYMAVLDIPYFILSVYIINKDELKYYVIKKDEVFIEKLIEAECSFWKDYVEMDVMPAPSGCSAESDVISSMFTGSAVEIKLDGESESLCAEYLLINEEIKVLENRKAQIANSLKIKLIEDQASSDEKKVRAVAGDYKILYSVYMRKSVDTDALKKAGLYEKYSKENESSMFRVIASKK